MYTINVRLGGRYRQIPVQNGKADLQVTATVPENSSLLESALDFCKAHDWSCEKDEHGNWQVSGWTAVPARKLNDSSVMDAYLQFGREVAAQFTGNPGRYYRAGVVRYREAA